MKFNITEFYVCYRCKVEKPLSEFHLSKHTKTGHHPDCKPCRANEARNRRISNHAEHLRKGKIYRDNNAETMRRCRREWREKNKEHQAKLVRDWAQKYPERKAVHTRNYRAKKRAQGGRHTRADIHYLLIEQSGRCNFCLCELVKYHVDHVHPVSRGGHNGRANLQLLCPQCNWTKADKMPVAA